MKFFIIWPEKRWIDESKIRLWFSDAVANGELSEEYATDITAPEDMAKELHSLGTITLGLPDNMEYQEMQNQADQWFRDAIEYPDDDLIVV